MEENFFKYQISQTVER